MRERFYSGWQSFEARKQRLAFLGTCGLLMYAILRLTILAAFKSTSEGLQRVEFTRKLPPPCCGRGLRHQLHTLGVR